jgi:hypothetical protein
VARKVLHPQKQTTAAAKQELRKKKTNCPSLGVKSSPHNTLLRKSWEKAISVSERDIAGFVPTDADIGIGEAILAGGQTVDTICKLSGLKIDRVKAVMTNPVAMAWISKQIYHLFQHRASIIDAALYMRAAGGDVQAMKLFYERMHQLGPREQNINVNYSGGVNIQALQDDELERIVNEKRRLLPAEFRRLAESATDAGCEEPEGSGDDLPGADGTGSAPPGEPPPVLQADAGGSPKATEIPRAWQGEEAPVVPGRQPDGKDNSG